MSMSRLAAAFVLLLAADVSASPVQRRTEVIHADPSLLDTRPMEAVRGGDLPSRTIYLNRCRGGCVVQLGQESANNNTSAIIDGVFSEFQYSQAQWDELVACVREVYAPFNIQIVEERPTSGTYWMNLVAGTAAQAGLPDGVLGVSPSTSACPAPFLTNTITFSFVNDPYASNDVNEWCWIVAQETAHSFGLDHEALRGDAMTYIDLGFTPVERHYFKDENGACGAYQAGDQGCYCPSIPQQNSYRAILDIFGAPCSGADECGSGLVCVAGNCVDGPDVPGGLGTACEDGGDCSSGTCTVSPENEGYCTESCLPGSGDCPSGFECLDNGGSGVCWPDGGGGGCCSAGGGAPTGAIGLGFLVGILMMRRRRAR